jgi:hypothetical protein
MCSREGEAVRQICAAAKAFAGYSKDPAAILLNRARVLLERHAPPTLAAHSAAHTSSSCATLRLRLVAVIRAGGARGSTTVVVTGPHWAPILVMRSYATLNASFHRRSDPAKSAVARTNCDAKGHADAHSACTRAHSFPSDNVSVPRVMVKPKRNVPRQSARLLASSAD